MIKQTHFKRYFTFANILVCTITSLFASLIFYYFIQTHNKLEIYAKFTVEDIAVPEFLNNRGVSIVDDHINLLIIRIINNSINDLDLNYIEIDYINEIYGVSSDINKIKYGEDVFNEKQFDFNKHTKILLFKGLKKIPTKETIGVFVWGNILNMPNILEIRSVSGVIPVISYNLLDSLPYFRIFLAKHMGIILAFIVIIFLYFYLRLKVDR